MISKFARVDSHSGTCLSSASIEVSSFLALSDSEALATPSLPGEYFDLMVRNYMAVRLQHS